jgi:hypothetical protein
MSTSSLSLNNHVSPTAAPKLRSSCDSCGVAKVKCDRSHPECGRCLALGSTCVYGLSRKSGKPPRKRLADELGTPTSLLAKRRLISTASERGDHTVTRITTQPTPDDGNPPDSLLDPLAQEFHLVPENYDPLILENNNQISSHISLPQCFSGWALFDDLPIVEETEYTDTRPPGTSALSAESQDIASPSSGESHSCAREPYEILRDLVCPSPDLHAPESNSLTITAQLDQVLHTNRNATERLSRLLGCPCAKSGHRAMMHASIVSRIILWYQQAAMGSGGGSEATIGTDGEDSPPISSPNSSDEAASMPLASTDINDHIKSKIPKLSQSTGFVVTRVGLSMGTFGIDDEVFQAVVRNQLVLSELKKVAAVIDLFFALNSGDLSAGSGFARLYLHLGAWLQTEHEKLVGSLTSRIRALINRLGLN